MYLLKIAGQSIEVEDWCSGIKRAREFHRGADYHKNPAGDYVFRELGGGKVGLAVMGSIYTGKGAAREVGMVLRQYSRCKRVGRTARM